MLASWLLVSNALAGEPAPTALTAPPLCLADGQGLWGHVEPHDGGVLLSLEHGWLWAQRSSLGACQRPLRVVDATGDVRSVRLRDRQVLYGTPDDGADVIRVTLLDGSPVLLHRSALAGYEPPPEHLPELAAARVAWESSRSGPAASPEQGVLVAAVVVVSVVAVGAAFAVAGANLDFGGVHLAP